jgi:hypothetical protein
MVTLRGGFSNDLLCPGGPCRLQFRRGEIGAASDQTGMEIALNNVERTWFSRSARLPALDEVNL